MSDLFYEVKDRVADLSRATRARGPLPRVSLLRSDAVVSLGIVDSLMVPQSVWGHLV